MAHGRILTLASWPALTHLLLILAGFLLQLPSSDPYTDLTDTESVGGVGQVLQLVGFRSASNFLRACLLGENRKRLEL